VFNLVRHDLRIAANSFLTAFYSVKDWVALALMVLLAGFFAADFLRGLENRGLPLSSTGLALYFAASAFFTYSFSHHRIRYFAEHSPLAFFALNGRSRRAYEAFWLGLALLVNYLVVAILYLSAGGREMAATLRAALVFGWAADLAGTAAALLWRRAAEGVRRAVGRIRLRLRRRAQSPERLPPGRLACLLNVTIKRQSLFGRTTVAAMSIVAGVGLALGLLGLGLGRVLSEWESLATLLLLLLLALVLLSRLNAGRIRFLRFLGFAPFAPGMMPVVAMAVLVAAAGPFVPLVAPTYAVPTAVLMLALLALFALVAYLRALHYRLKTRSRADLAIQLDGLCIALLGFAFAPLALVFVLVRIYRLHRAARAATWTLS
jgi:hypothetical protein